MEVSSPFFMVRKMARKKKSYVNYQQMSYDFKVGDPVVPLYSEEHIAGRLVALYPAIGMADVQFPYGNGRFPVEDIQKVNDNELGGLAPKWEDIPGGAGTVSVPGGPKPLKRVASAERVATAFMKQALYWDKEPREYRATRSEQEGGNFSCPRCRQSPMSLRKYKIEGKLLVCPNCNFLIKRENIKGSGFEPPELPEISPRRDLQGLVLGGKK